MEAIALALRYWKYIAAILLVIGVVTYYNVHVGGLIKEAVDKAVVERDGQWREQEAVAIAKAKADATAQETIQRARLEAQSRNLERRLKDAKTIHDRDVASARSGALKLRFSTALCPSPSNVSSPSSPPIGSNGPTTIELPGEITANLYRLADDADQVADRLRACQDVVRSYTNQPMKGMP